MAATHFLARLIHHPPHAESFTNFFSGLIPYINHFYYGNNIKQFQNGNHIAAVGQQIRRLWTARMFFTGLYSSLTPSNNPINARLFDSVAEIEGFNRLFFWRISFIYKKCRTHHHDASDTKPLKTNLIYS